MCTGVQEAVAERPQPATWPEFWRDLASRAAGRARRAGRGGAGEPAWARPGALLLAIAAAWPYCWHAFQPVNVEIYYAAAVRSMTMGPSNFFFGAIDPAALKRGNISDTLMIMLAVLAANAIISATISGRLRPQLRRLIGAGQVGLFLRSPVTTDPRLVWVARLCLRIRERAGGTRPAVPLAVYFCVR